MNNDSRFEYQMIGFIKLYLLYALNSLQRNKEVILVQVHFGDFVDLRLNNDRDEQGRGLSYLLLSEKNLPKKIFLQKEVSK